MEKHKKSVAGLVGVWQLSAGVIATVSNVLIAKIAAFILLAMIVNKVKTIDLPGLKNGYWKDKHLKH